MDIKQVYLGAIDNFSAKIAAVSDTGWSDPTPDSDWDVRALVNHVVGETLWVADMLAGRTVAEVGDKYDGDQLGNDPKAAWTKAAAAAGQAVKALTDLSATVHLSFGDNPASEYLRQMSLDTLIHSWDLARAAKTDETLPAELVTWAQANFPDEAGWRQMGLIGPKPEIPADADPQIVLLARFGRKV